ncbi:hypothetical protein IPM65_04735 [Candidatus Roizmanbacteria bacterium]|nr:MAG: hypothetical protein IPM65_04735 [Candidatus Roizmanbacteria bacterium]
MPVDPNETNESIICIEPIAIAHIARDITALTEHQIPRSIKEEMLSLLSQGRTRIRYSHRMEDRKAGTSAGVGFSGHVFQDDELYTLIYRAVLTEDELHWQLQGVFTMEDPYTYQW